MLLSGAGEELSVAKGRPADSSVRANRVRIVMMDADLSDAAVNDLSNVLLNAFKPAQVRSLERKALAPVNEAANGEQAELGPDGAAEDAPGPHEDVDDGGAQAVTPSKPRKLPLPKYLHDLDTSGGGTTLKTFVDQHPSKKHLRRYLVGAYWMKHHGSQNTVNADQMYTIYRTVGWQPNINDWDSNFRSLVKANKLRRVSPGEYTITPIGEADIEDGEAETT